MIGKYLTSRGFNIRCAEKREIVRSSQNKHYKTTIMSTKLQDLAQVTLDGCSTSYCQELAEQRIENYKLYY